MSRWVKTAGSQSFSLLVSIPRNQPDMAKAAEAGGADAIKIHLNCKHPASGHLFGNFQKEKKNIESVLKSISIPLGIVPGAESTASAQQLIEMRKMGIDFFDIFAHHMPLDYLTTGLGRMICLDSRYTPLDARRLAKHWAQVFECSIIPHEGYGEPVSVADLNQWRALTENLQIPLLVSTQRKIKPEECEELKRAGVAGIVIGVIVTGETASGVQKVTRQFRQAIDLMSS